MMPDFNRMAEVNISLLCFSALITLFMLIGLLSDQIVKRPFIKIFVCVLFTNILMQLGEAGIWFFDGLPGMAGMRKVNAGNRYRGEYMAQYGWAEFTNVELEKER